MRENPFNRATFRFYEALREETENWLRDVMKGVLAPPGSARQRQGISAYFILELDASASEQEVKKRYRELAHYLHPDTASVKGTTLFFRQVQAAYEAIKEDRGWR
ncbi:MAG: J domain-containing protein [Chloroflexi bacterium]|nr:J domain-containing protein [Chloroflexota bacterium]